MHALRGMLGQLLADRSITSTPTTPLVLALGNQLALAVAPHPVVPDPLHLGASPPTGSASSAARGQPEFRVTHIPVRGSSSGLHPSRLSRALLPYSSWAVPPYQDPVPAVPQHE